MSKAPLLRAGLIQIGDEKHLLMVDIHHIVSDGSSMGILVKDFMALYSEEELPSLRLQYKDYSQWQRSKEVKEKILKQKDFWIKEFAGEIPVLNLPLDFTRPVVQCFEGDSVNFELDPLATKRLKDFAAEKDVTLNMVLIAGLNVFLAKLSGQEEIIIGTPTAGRRHADLQHIIGMFVNTLALGNFPNGGKRFVEFLKEVKERTLAAFENQEYPFEDLVDLLSPDRDISRNPLFDVMFTLQLMDIPEIKIPGLKLKPYNRGSSIARFDLTLYAVEMASKLFFTFEYGTRLFKKDTVRRFANYFKNIMSSVLETPGKKLSQLEIVTGGEKDRILYDFNKTAIEFPGNKTIHRLFAERVAEGPHRIAVVYEDKQLTYGELNKNAGQLAGFLGKRGVAPGSIVGVMMNRSPDLVTGILAILKAGGAYLPLDPAYPAARRKFMLEDSGVKVLLTEKHFTPVDKDFLSGLSEHVLAVDDEAVYSSIGCFPPGPTAKPKDLLYVIYTSGSTGKPKGVMIPHVNFVNLVECHRSIFGEGSGARMSQVAGLSFDAMAFEIWPCLTSGASLYIADDNTRINPPAMKDWLIKNEITISFQPTMMAEYLLRLDWPEQGTALQALRAAGDRLTAYPGKGWHGDT